MLISDFVLSSISVCYSMKIQHNLNQHNLPQQHQTAQNILRDLIISRGITVIEHDILFGGICFKDEPYLAIF